MQNIEKILVHYDYIHNRIDYQIDKKESLTVSQQAKLEQIPGWN